MKPTTISEKMQYSTLRLETKTGQGTGFFLQFQMDGHSYPIIITNKHVINNKTEEEVKFTLHLKNDSNESKTDRINIALKTKWYHHSTQDLCFCPAAPLFQYIKETRGKDVFYAPILEEIIYSKEKLLELNAIEDVVMVGYPSGLIDENNVSPLFRKGITAIHPSNDFKYKEITQNNIGVVDMACYPGSSGSPIFILNEGVFTDKTKKLLQGNRIIFLGVQFAIPIRNKMGEIKIEEIPASQRAEITFQDVLNFGYYIKAHELLEFKETIKGLIPNEPPQ